MKDQWKELDERFDDWRNDGEHESLSDKNGIISIWEVRMFKEYLHSELEKVRQEGYVEGYSKGMTKGYLERSKDLPNSYQKGKQEGIRLAIEALPKTDNSPDEDFNNRGFLMEESNAYEIGRKDGRNEAIDQAISAITNKKVK